MRIKFLGTSSGSCRAGRRCSCTMIQIGKKRYVIDMGILINEDLEDLGLTVNDISAVFITHMHSDHTDGLLSFLRYRPLGTKTVFLPPPADKTIEAIKLWFECNYDKRSLLNINFNEITEGEIYDDGTLKVTAYRTRHSEYSYSFLLEAEGKRVLFTGDMTRNPETDFAYGALEGGLDLAVCELGHFPAYKYAEVFKDKVPKKIYINHISTKFIDTAYAFQRESELPIRLTHDGREVEI